MIRRLACLVALAAAALPSVAEAQPQAEPVTTPIELRPAAAPVPALKYQLLPERRELLAGNAAIDYHRAIEMVLNMRYQERSQAALTKPPSPRPEPFEDSVQRWISGPLGEIPHDKARELLRVSRNALHEVELGARRDDCNWELDHREEGFSLLLPEIQETRTLARLVALRIRLEIAEGRTEEAIRWLQTGFALSRHVSRGPTLIHALVGTAIASVITGTLEDLIQAPGAPNLFWALANLPRPLIDIAPGLEGERNLLEREIPRLRDLDSEPWSLEQARSFAGDLHRELSMLIGAWSAAETSSGPPRMVDWGSQLHLTALVARTYPEAKRFLIAQGRPAARVEALPVIQAVGLYSMKIYEQIRDESFKWANLPFRQADEGLARTEREIATRFPPQRQGIPFAVVIPAIRSALLAPLRLDRRLAEVRCIEAIRLYAADHRGALPPGLDAIDEVPVPADPVTGQPFEYAIHGRTAILSTPAWPGKSIPRSSITFRYELKPAR